MRALGVVLVLGVAAALGFAAPASGAQQLITIDTPSRVVDPTRTAVNGGIDRLRANVLLPDGYDDARRRFPVLYLLHGVGDTFNSWRDPERGDVERTLAGFPAIVVMPEGGKGFYTDWFNGGRRADPSWETFYRSELVPLIEERFRVAPGRRNHAVAGLSMGGLGATYLAEQLPGYFGAVASFSGFVDHQRPEVGPGIRAAGGPPYEDIFGPMAGQYASGHNPTLGVVNLRHSRLFVAAGDGTAPRGATSPAAIAGGGPIEAGLRPQSDALAAAARAAGVTVDYQPQGGVHDWVYWREHLRQFVAFGPFAAVEEDPSTWTLRTIAQRGDAWGLRFAFAAAPEEVVVLRREGSTVHSTAPVELRDALDCRGAGTELRLPLTDCGGRPITVRLSRGSLRVGRTASVRVRATVAVEGRGAVALPGARVRVGRAQGRTGEDGSVTLRVPAARRGSLRVAVAREGFAKRVARLRVR